MRRPGPILDHVRATMDGMIPDGLDALHVLGEYWHRHGPTRTDLGQLLHAAKDRGRSDAAAELAGRIVELAPAVSDSAGAGCLVTAVPTHLDPVLHVPSVLGRALADSGVGEWVPDLVVRKHPTPRLRDVDLDQRADVATAAGYRATAAASGAVVVLVDDVILTGTTLAHVGQRLRDAGARSVVGVAAALTRRA